MTRISRDPLGHLARALEELDVLGLRRRPPPLSGVVGSTTPSRGSLTISFCSNDYLGLASQTSNRIAPTAMGSGASRLIAGEHSAHRDLEAALSEWLDVEDCLLFTSGYAANVGVVSSLAEPGQLVVSDALNHASIIDGARLSKARIAITPHNDLNAVRSALASRTEEHAWVVAESYFSMDADGPDLVALRAACDEYGAGLIVDEAHALGVLGPQGRGCCADAGVRPDVLIGTLGKAFGGQGAFAAGRSVVRDWLWNRARSFVFSTGLAPVSAAGALDSLSHIQSHASEREALSATAKKLRQELSELGLRLGGFGHVIPIIMPSIDDALHLSARLRDNGIIIPAIRPPTVPTARLRLTVTARHSTEDLDTLITAFKNALQTSTCATT